MRLAGRSGRVPGAFGSSGPEVINGAFLRQGRRFAPANGIAELLVRKAKGGAILVLRRWTA
jgi:hypothetical protein